MQKRYVVYLLSAGKGKWGYIGHTGNIGKRHWEHQYAIKHNQKPDWWVPAIKEFPNPDDWEIAEIAGPFDTAKEALEEECRLQEWANDEPGKLWDSIGNSKGQHYRNKRSGERHHMWGKNHTKSSREKMSAQRRGVPKSEAWKAKRKATEAEKRYIKKFFTWFSDPIT